MRKFVSTLKTIFLSFGAILTLTNQGPLAIAATIELSSDSRCGYELSGEITNDDYLILSKKLQPDNERQSVCLNSDGGSLIGGMNLYDLFMTEGIPTYVRNGDQCHSACALAFLGGSVWGDFRHNIRQIEPGAVVAFHAPYLQSETGMYSADDLARTARLTIGIIKRLIKDRGDSKISEWFLLNFILEDSKETKPLLTFQDAAHAGVDIVSQATGSDFMLTLAGMKNACELLFDRYSEAFIDPSTAITPEFQQETSEYSRITNPESLAINGESWPVVSMESDMETPFETASCAFAPSGDTVLIWNNDVSATSDQAKSKQQLRLEIPFWYFLGKEKLITSLQK